MDIIFTIGHSNHEITDLVALLKQHKVDLILDVRSTPYSKRYPQYNQEEFRLVLGSHQLAYQSFGLWFGARQPDMEYYTPEGWLHYSAYAKSGTFAEGIRSLDQCLIQGYSPALLCSEKDPFDCHRAIMVARALSLKGYEIQHILADGSILSQAKLDQQILDKYFPHRDQGNIFDLIEGRLSEEEMLSQAYLKRNEAIAWRRDDLEQA
ncbi:MAG: DUF488 domain-containing protein [Candidatus Cloacimonetes bacterium]|jgi:uncharacterized protein (DUF488 family)|nr:DUF488 domain-containing protein [Candidatus Cloacimonadota bacterium]MCB5287543.1 DUF488 domain-containing protein [Candidatus Cloacimonadota bacterium]MCK9184094.1 DUF488 domain-containing protein [Candidatus Cloacimonadota bacterium]MCK9584949.1 DUF488 domain-containing protein [Candidatus Cloacimonadota bacterium]MDY0229864.1 DUF488 domain-containing protein [Candidatus Cloacimonadaceae bacterium]